ncbi:MAG: PIN domain-containing protein [Pseudomonadota bacterium]|nr:PIN domain-containing protein [Pseudomonadota bacterium]
MIAVDTNLLIYAHRLESPFHRQAGACIRSLAEGRGSWAIPWPCVHEFFSVATNPRVFASPTPVKLALETIDAWFAAPTLQLLHETSSHWDLLRGLVRAGHVTGPRVHDARIAALCLQHGVRELWSADRDFGLFPAVTVRNPLVS